MTQTVELHCLDVHCELNKPTVSPFVLPAKSHQTTELIHTHLKHWNYRMILLAILAYEVVFQEGIERL